VGIEDAVPPVRGGPEAQNGARRADAGLSAPSLAAAPSRTGAERVEGGVAIRPTLAVYPSAPGCRLRLTLTSDTGHGLLAMLSNTPRPGGHRFDRAHCQDPLPRGDFTEL